MTDVSRYYFDVIDDNSIQRDEVGVMLDSADDVRRYVSHMLTDLLRDELADAAHGKLRITVRDDVDFEVFQAETSLNSSWAD